MQHALGLGLLALGQLVENVGGLMHPASLLTGLGPDLADRLPEAERAIGDGDLGRHRQTPALEIEQQGAPVVSALARAVDKAEQLLLALRRGADDDQDALRLVLQTRLQVDAVGPDVDVAFGRRVALAPLLLFLDPDVVPPSDGSGRKAKSILAEQGGQRRREVAGRHAFQIQDRDQRIEALRTPGVGQQDCRRGSGCAPERRRPPPGRARAGWRTATGPMPVMIWRSGGCPCRTDAPAAVVGLQIGGRGQKLRHFGFDRLGKKRPRAIAQNPRSAGRSKSLAESV